MIYLAKMNSRCLTKMTSRFAFMTSFGHLQDVFARRLAYLNKTSLRYLTDFFLRQCSCNFLHELVFLREILHRMHYQHTAFYGQFSWKFLLKKNLIFKLLHRNKKDVEL